MKENSFGTKKKITIGGNEYVMFHLNELERRNIGNTDHLPFSIKILLEGLLRHENGIEVQKDDVLNLINWNAKNVNAVEMPYQPGRVILQDFTGVPAVVDLAALRSAAIRLGGDPQKINPQILVALVIDHSVSVDFFGSHRALQSNSDLEFERNRERYEFLKWAANTFSNFRAVPPATGIVHQVNLEFLANVVQSQKNGNGETVLFPDTLVGTDSHTPMINGLGVVGWGVGGIEAEATMLGQPIYMLVPEVIGFKLTGELPEGATATDLVLTVTQMLRTRGVVGKFVEYFGPGLDRLPLADRATIANMSPEYGATIGFFPVDNETLNYLRSTGRSEDLVQRVEIYCKEQGLFRTADTPNPVYTDTLELNLGDVVPSIAGPKRPQDRISLHEMKKTWHQVLELPPEKRGFGLEKNEKEKSVTVRRDDFSYELTHGSVVIAAITSCTNTSNPSVMVAAGLLARKAIQAGLRAKPWVKTSMAPGSKVVTQYLESSGLTPYLEGLGFHTVGYGCTTCIGNSGPLPEHISKVVNENNLIVASVLSGNRNFEGRINPDVQANFLASPPLVVAYALAGTVNIDLNNEALGHDPNGHPVYLTDIWPSNEEIKQAVQTYLSSEIFHQQYSNVYDGNETWNKVVVPEGDVYRWDAESTYIQEPPFFKDITNQVPDIPEIRGAKVLAWLPDSTTTDHISPAGAIAERSPAGQYLIGRGVEKRNFNSYGSRRGNHEVMMRGTLANIRIKNKLVPGVEGGYTIFQPSDEQMPMWDAAVKYMAENTPLIILAGKEYGTGSSRDWAAKGVFLQGVKAVIAESYERIHRSNLVGMGIMPLQFEAGQSAESLNLDGWEKFDILGLDNNLQPGTKIFVRAEKPDGAAIEFNTICRIDTPVEVEYYRNGGILHTVLRKLLK